MEFISIGRFETMAGRYHDIMLRGFALSSRMDAEDIGRDAYYDDCEYDENPYTPNTQDYWDWSKGWLDAQFEGSGKNWD